MHVLSLLICMTAPCLFVHIEEVGTEGQLVGGGGALWRVTAAQDTFFFYGMSSKSKHLGPYSRTTSTVVSMGSHTRSL